MSYLSVQTDEFIKSIFHIRERLQHFPLLKPNASFHLWSQRANLSHYLPVHCAYCWEFFSLHNRVKNGSGAHPASYPMGTMGSFPGGTAAETVHSPPSSAGVKE